MMRQEYTIVDGHDKSSVITDVNGCLLQGWLLHGGLCIQTLVLPIGKITTRYAQALVREFELQTP